MDQLVQDLSLALEDSEPCGPANFKINRRWGIKRRTRSAGNLHLCVSKSGDNHSDDSSSSNNENRLSKHLSSFHQSDSDDMSISMAIAKSINKSSSLRMKNNMPAFLSLTDKCGPLSKALNYSLESDSFNENSPARPSIRRKRKLKRMCVDEAPVPQCGKRKRPQRLDGDSFRSLRHIAKIKPLNQSIIDKMEKFCIQAGGCSDAETTMDTQCTDDTCELGSESSVSWSGDEGHEGDDELTDWGAQPEPAPAADCWTEVNPRKIWSGRRRLHDVRPGFSIKTGANERVSRFLQDSAKSQLRLYGAERDKLIQLAALYSLDLWFDGSNSLLRKTDRTPCMQPTQRHHSGLATGHKRICTHEAKLI